MDPRSPKPLLRFVLLGGLALSLSACAQEADPPGGDALTQEEAVPVTLGPKDGFDLPPTEIERVALGSYAPDFSLRTLVGDTLTLSDFRGEKDVLLVFYRGHW